MIIQTIIFILFITTANQKDNHVSTNFYSPQPACQPVDFMQLQNKVLQENFFNQLDSILHVQYPKNDKEAGISVDLNQILLSQFLKDIDPSTFSKTGRFEKEYHFNIAPAAYSDPETCKDKISIEFYPERCMYRMVIRNSFLVEPNWCTEHQVIYSFTIENDKIEGFERNEAG